MEKVKVDINFRIDKDGVFALFPHECSYSNFVTCYQHVGQHSSAEYRGCIRSSKSATPKQYKDLKKELKSIGYVINVVKRQNYNKFLKSYHNNK